MPHQKNYGPTAKVSGKLSVKRVGKRSKTVKQPLSPNPGMTPCYAPYLPAGTNSVGSKAKSY
jgi:hypothetical protein